MGDNTNKDGGSSVRTSFERNAGFSEDRHILMAHNLSEKVLKVNIALKDISEYNEIVTDGSLVPIPKGKEKKKTASNSIRMVIDG